ncbi:18678_t:CDS:2 [Rhizophagus irregularis]|nr:18678_t:CDS:2 [Rhizophagus irregularis]
MAITWLILIQSFSPIKSLCATGLTTLDIIGEDQLLVNFHMDTPF